MRGEIVTKSLSKVDGRSIEKCALRSSRTRVTMASPPAPSGP